MVTTKNNSKKTTLLGYELTGYEDVIVNYLIPSISACVLYIFIIASDVAVIVNHYKNGDPIWASLTLFIMYLPVLGSYIIFISNWELWPEYEGCGLKNAKWFFVKTMEHLLFPVWSMWRFAERIFWSIEAARSNDESDIMEAKSIVSAARTIELYVFLQSYLHALPQILLQLFILVRHNLDINKQTVDAQVLSIIFNLAKVSVTTTYYQRFKAQKLTGRQYPWYKSYKMSPPSSVVLRHDFTQSRSIVEKRRTVTNIEEIYNVDTSRFTEHRRSSDIYLEPSTSSIDKNQAFVDPEPFEAVEPRSFERRTLLKEVSVVEVPTTSIFRETGFSERSEPDFNISRIVYVKGLEEDDLAGKLIAFLWWFCFLLARLLAITAFAYFFIKEAFWLLCSHFLIVMAFLLYDVKSDEVKRAKAIFFLFIGIIYVFCIIEFKIRFKKATFIYYGFFALVFLENFIMCMIWYLGEIESIENDFWFRYIFYIVVMCTLTSFSSMVFYFTVTKPPKVVVETRALSV